MLLAMGRQVVVAGYARMPNRSPARLAHPYLEIGVTVDVETHKVLHASSNLGSLGGAEWLEQHLVGENLLDPDSTFATLIRRDYWTLTKGTILQCHRDLVRRYRLGLQREGLLPAGEAIEPDDDAEWLDMGNSIAAP